MKILFIADKHFKLGQKNVPKDWQINRFLQLAHQVVDIYDSQGCDLIIDGGDVFDTNKPTSDEIDLAVEFFTILKGRPTILYTGNHEMLNKKYSALYNFTSMFREISKDFTVITEPFRSPEFDIIDYTELHKKEWEPAQSKLCFTHVRGAIPPHVVPEIDLTRFVKHGYSMVVAGDLHSYQNSQDINGTPLLYPGSPLTTSFHREITKNTNGVFIIDTDTLKVEWVELGHLPQLITKTISVGDEMVKDPYHHVMYELEGDIRELKSVENSELLKKKINRFVATEATLNLSDKSLIEELNVMWKDVYKLSDAVIARLSSRLGKYHG